MIASLRAPRQALDNDGRLMRLFLLGYVAFFLVTLVLPLYALVSTGMTDGNGNFVGLANFRTYFETPSLVRSLTNSFQVTLISTVIVTFLAFAYAYALTRTCMPFKGAFKLIALIPLLSPSLLAAIALIYWFGNQGVLRDVMMGTSIYGPTGIIMASVFWTFPHALMLMITALSVSDARLYEAAAVMKTSPLRTFLTVTLPGARYGLISAFIVVFILIFTDFGVPKVIGGNYNVLATDIYKEVVGQQNFQMGAVVSTVLLIPAVIAFAIDRRVQKSQRSALNARSVSYHPKPNRTIDTCALVFCVLMSVIIFGIVGMAQFASLVKFWPYNLDFTLKHYEFNSAGVGWFAFFNSLKLAFWTAMIGTPLIFFGAYLVEKPPVSGPLRPFVHLMALIPLAVPGLVLGLSYIFFFNHPLNPLVVIYGTMGIMVLNTVTHFYSVSHLTAVTALKQIDREFEAVSASLKRSVLHMFFRVTLPVSLPAVLDIWAYMFVNAMTTVSGVIFLYGASTILASVGAIHLDEQGASASAAAMAMLIFYASVVVRLLHAAISRVLLKRTQAWRLAK